MVTDDDVGIFWGVGDDGKGRNFFTIFSSCENIFYDTKFVSMKVSLDCMLFADSG
jgi:hypothetical protein